MAITVTTLSGAITAYQTQFNVASTTYITAPVLTTGSGYTWLYCDAELMFCMGVPVSGTIQVVRGMLGTQAVAHLTGALVVVGLSGDFPQFAPAVSAFQTLSPNRFQGIYPPVAAATTITASGPVFHITGTTATATISLPSGFVEGSITVIADGAWTWTTAGNIANTGAATSAGTTVTFTYDANTSKWYPSRIS